MGMIREIEEQIDIVVACVETTLDELTTAKQLLRDAEGGENNGNNHNSDAG